MIDALRKQINGLVEYVTRRTECVGTPLKAKLGVLEYEARLVPAGLVPKTLLAAFFDGTYFGYNGNSPNTISFDPISATQGVVAVTPATGAESSVSSDVVAITIVTSDEVGLTGGPKPAMPKGAKPAALAVADGRVFVAFSKQGVGGQLGDPNPGNFVKARAAEDDASAIRLVDPATGASSPFAVKGRETLALAPSADGRQLLAAWFDGTYGVTNPDGAESATEGVSSFNPATGVETVLFSQLVAAPSKTSSGPTVKFDALAAVGDRVFVARSQYGFGGERSQDAPGGPTPATAPVDDTSTILSINPATGVGTPLAAKGRETLALTASADGKLLLAAYFDGVYDMNGLSGVPASATRGVVAFDPATGNEAVLYSQPVDLTSQERIDSHQGTRPTALAAIDGQVFIAYSGPGSPFFMFGRQSLSAHDDSSTIVAIDLATGTSTPFPVKGRETLALAAVPAAPAVVVPPENAPPTLTPRAGFASRAVPSGTFAVTGIAFDFADDQTDAAALGVAVTSSNPALLPNEAARFGLTRTGGSGALTLTPVAGVSGSATVSVTVTDAGGLAATSSFVLTVTAPPNTAPTLTPKAGFANRAAPSGAVAVTGIAFDFADAQTAATALGVAVTSSNPAVLANDAAHLVLTRSGGSGALTLSPQRGAFGATTVTVTVTDAGGLTATSSFVVSVAAPLPSAPVVPADVLALMPALGANPRVATADLNGDGVPDYVGVTSAGGVNLLQFFDGKTRTVVASFSPFEAGYSGGMYVATGDLTGTGRVDVIVSPDAGGGPVVAVYNGTRLAGGVTGDAAQVVRFLGIDDPAFRGGVRVATGLVNGTSALVVSAGFGGGPRVAVFRGSDVGAGNAAPGRLVADFFAFEDTLRNGAYVAAGDVNGDGVADFAFGGGPGGGPRVRVIDGKSLLAAAASLGSLDALPPTAQLANFFAGEPTGRDGVRVAFRDVYGDGKADLTTQGGAGGVVRVYKPGSLIARPTAPVPDSTLDPVNGAFAG